MAFGAADAKRGIDLTRSVYCYNDVSRPHDSEVCSDMDSLSLPTLPLTPVPEPPAVVDDFDDEPARVVFPVVYSVNTYFYDAGPRLPLPYPDSDD